MLILKRLDLNNDSHRLIMAVTIVMVVTIMFVSPWMSSSNERHNFSFKNTLNSLFSRPAQASDFSLSQLTSANNYKSNINLLTQKDNVLKVSIGNKNSTGEQESETESIDKFKASKGDGTAETNQLAQLSKSSLPTPESILISGALSTELVYQNLTVGAPPSYSYKARKNELEGKVVIKLLVNKHGLIDLITMTKSSGHKTLDDDVLKAVNLWIFDTNAIGHKAKEFMIEFNFSLN